MSVYSNLQIRKAIANHHIVFHPFISEHIRGSSIDMTLGDLYYQCERLNGRRTIFNPFDQIDVDSYFSGPVRAMTSEEMYERGEIGVRRFVGIEDDHPIILIPGRSRVLAHTHEFIGINPPGTSEMRARSSWGRNGIAVCLCAGWGDPGYINRWTMEIHNMNDEAVPIPVGERIAQLVFHETGDVAGSYGDGGGKYQESREIEEIVAAWSPQQMLPRSYKDERRLPLPI